VKPLKELVVGIYHSLPPSMKNLVDGEMPQEEVARHIEKAREFAESIGYPAQLVRVPRVRIFALSRGLARYSQVADKDWDHQPSARPDTSTSLS